MHLPLKLHRQQPVHRLALLVHHDVSVVLEERGGLSVASQLRRSVMTAFP